MSHFGAPNVIGVKRLVEVQRLVITLKRPRHLRQLFVTRMVDAADEIKRVLLELLTPTEDDAVRSHNRIGDPINRASKNWPDGLAIPGSPQVSKSTS